ncbi:MAG TPA: hypothetical protein VG916_13135, partial [Gemmatimonadaceae bacterium]|nr:hypothetical protein [Gemmatimonadaceae bacterium]
WRRPDTARVEAFRRTTGDPRSEAHENFAREWPVPPGAATTFRWTSGADTELLGLATGVRYRIAGPMSRDGPSPGWAAEEARRMAAAAQPAIWLVASHYFEGTPRDELQPLIAALGAAGLEVVQERRGGRDAVALRVERIVRSGRPARQ